MTAVATWPGRAESWLDDRGKGAWIAAMVVGFIVFWPIGLAILAYMIWGKQMFGKSCKANRANRTHLGVHRPSGNAAFDSYKSETLKRLEDEQAAFGAFLDRLREAKDKAEFDAFMDERARKRAEEARAADAEA
ncbi:DUF2852 domain-containing protein [Pararhodobacter sp. SW119]|uniref:DUF2852 domain-containing protein n=1 Tax=Pararhodobacter sp. SW119 TaxID=2780075 RepID=UPI001ADF2150|nr:DUF2852 domain-containing protein [Pararhodobacter sp. SW119]